MVVRLTPLTIFPPIHGRLNQKGRTASPRLSSASNTRLGQPLEATTLPRHAVQARHALDLEQRLPRIRQIAQSSTHPPMCTSVRGQWFEPHLGRTTRVSALIAMHKVGPTARPLRLSDPALLEALSRHLRGLVRHYMTTTQVPRFQTRCQSPEEVQATPSCLAIQMQMAAWMP